ncbi:MAG: antiterminator LoaP [Clostridiales bacterium]|nr:antiterminator LoaP [Clostridiales bacterium]
MDTKRRRTRDKGESTMWYAMQVTTGQEKETIFLCRELIGQECLEDMFCPQIATNRHFRGEWHKIMAPMFPGYIFAITNRIEELYEKFYQVPKLTKILGTDKTPVPLTEEEVCFIQGFTDEEHVAGLSEGILVGDKLIVRSGPLKGKEGLVRFIDRHKRIARVEVEMFGGMKIGIEMGLEVTQKLPAKTADNDSEKKSE